MKKPLCWACKPREAADHRIHTAGLSWRIQIRRCGARGGGGGGAFLGQAEKSRPRSCWYNPLKIRANQSGTWNSKSKKVLTTMRFFFERIVEF